MKKPSVTQLTKILDKPALMSWANKIGLEGIRLDEYRKKVMSNGTSLHKQIEMFILNGDLPENETLRERLPLFMENKEFLLITLTQIIAVASLLVAGTKTPDPSTILGKAYTVVEFLALNFARAKEVGEKKEVVVVAVDKKDT